MASSGCEEGRAILPSEAEGEREPAENLAIEEALFLRNRGLVLRVWENRESVIIGRAQLAHFETDIEFCERNQIPIVRRFTAGGTVYNGPGNLNWSVFVSRAVRSGQLRYESDPHRVFRIASEPLVSALSERGVKAWLDPPNRVLTADGKISGMAAYVSRDGFLCHGTLLIGADLGRVKMLTTPASGRIERRYTRSRDVGTANVAIDVDSFIRTYVRMLADETGMTIQKGTLDGAEIDLMRELVASRYGRSGWNLGDHFESSSQLGAEELAR